MQQQKCIHIEFNKSNVLICIITIKGCNKRILLYNRKNKKQKLSPDLTGNIVVRKSTIGN